MKTKKYAINFLLITALILALDSIIIKYLAESLAFNKVLILNIAVLFIFLIGTIIVAPALEKEPKNFVGSFLILTTVKMISILFVFAAVVYTKIENVKLIVLHALLVFVIILIFQSILLIKSTK
jgi:hypothetical protein